MREKKELLRAFDRIEEGDFSARITSKDVDSDLSQAFNRVVRLNARMADEFERVSRLVGRKASCSTARPSRA